MLRLKNKVSEFLNRLLNTKAQNMSKDVTLEPSIIDLEVAKRKKQLEKEKKYKTINISRKFIDELEMVSVRVVNGDVAYHLREMEIDGAYDRIPDIPISVLVFYFDEIIANDNECMRELKDFMSFSAQDLSYKCKELTGKGLISFDTLFYCFKKNAEVFTIDNGEISAGIVKSTKIVSSWAGKFCNIECVQVDTNGRYFQESTVIFSIGFFPKAMEIDKLPVKILDEKTKAELTERGRRFERLAIGASYTNYEGQMMIDTWFGPIFYRADGRLMTDTPSFDKRDKYGNSGRARNAGTVAESKTLAVEKLPFHTPYLKGFSFSLKKWGKFAISTMKDIEFNTKAFDTLVLDGEKKSIISSLVKNANSGFKDIIAGKSGGCIFLLHGPPGVGKTLTAEAIAESMHRPLYSVSVGELGIDPATLENSLREILDIAQTWNAVILIDEADIFLEARNEQDILRNAMVGVFLRLLEYHQGVLFLTTNRVKNFDHAFHSRISVALHYKAHDDETREKIWKSLLESAGIKGIETKALAKHNINGRQIKTTIRLAQALAADRKEEVGMAHLERTIDLQADFTRDLIER